MSQIIIFYLWICLRTFVTEVSLIRTLIGEKIVIKYMIVLSKHNGNEKKSLKLRETWVKVYKRYSRL